MQATHTFAELEVSDSAYGEIAQLLRKADYHHVFVDGKIDMHGIALVARKNEKLNACLVCEGCKERIEETEARVIWHDLAGQGGALHHCCFVDHFLFEVFGALVLGVKYECVCLHRRNSDDFEVTFLSRQLSKATTKLIVRNVKGGAAMKR